MLNDIEIGSSPGDKCQSEYQIDSAAFDEKTLRKSGIDIAGDISWGSHFCVFYQSKEDLIDILAPYFKAGLENNEFCIWITSDLFTPLEKDLCEDGGLKPPSGNTVRERSSLTGFTIDEAKNAIKKIMPDFENYLVKGHMMILPHTRWYLENGIFDMKRVFCAWMNKLKSALDIGYDGIRVSGDTLWLEGKNWKDFSQYEKEVENAISKYKMIAVCAYPLNKYKAVEILDVIKYHQAAFIRYEGKWEIIESSGRKKVRDALRVSEQKFKDLVETTTDWVWEVDKEGIYTYVNPKVKDLLGYKPDEVLGKTPFDFMPPKEAGKIREFFKEKLNKKEPFYRLENVNRHKDGNLVILETSGIAVFDEKGRFKGYRGIDRDITERKEMEKKLQMSEIALKKQNLTLEQKNIALGEMLEHIEWVKKKMKDDIAVNINEILLPLLRKLPLKGKIYSYVKMLQYYLQDLTSSFGHKILQENSVLTPREIEICKMIRGGLSSKELSTCLNVSLQTIEKHRRNIRKKLSISNKKVNLTAYLQQI